ncbi:MAG TPA: CpsB/CapC family capsule biosynthesis tyrosine phosphatase [Cyclobacteriaceae bacterium]|nr:CpsB/CapC family capsule biosynthesis tyrosine phosphatase [Cyclobacteriaceae bacterium]
MLNWFRKGSITPQGVLPVIDIHSHLLPGLDDGVQLFEDAETIILQFQRLGYNKLITTPHVMSDFFRNTNEIILAKHQELNQWLSKKGIQMEVQPSGEYYLDEVLLKKIENNEPLLTFGKNYLLFETNFMNEPLNLKEFIFMATTKGYKLILAHPERYLYLQSNFSKAEDLLNRGLLFQLNISSISGYYSKAAQTTAQKLIDKGWVHFLGSDCHNLQHIQLLEETRNTKYFQKAISLPLLNNSL